MMKARRRKILVVILLLGGVAASIAATVGRPYSRGIRWMLGLRESTYYGWHTNLQDVMVIRHDKKIDLRVTPVQARMRA